MRTGDGVYSAVQGASAVIHAASSPFKETAATDVEGTRKLLEQVKAARVPHFVYVSIVGIEKVPTDYYRAKVAAEALVKESGIPFTIVRATQFFDLIDMMLRGFSRVPGLVAVPSGFLFQPIDVAEVAAEIARRAVEPPAGVVELGGPQTLTFRALAQDWVRARGMRRWLMPLPVPGAMGTAMRAGHLAGAPTVGKRTWGEWLTARYSAP